MVGSGFVDFQITWRKDVFEGAALAGPSKSFDTKGVNFRARKPD